MEATQFLRFSHRFEDVPIRGYVVDIGPTFFLMALVSGDLWLDGFECFRLNDVAEVMPDPYTDFAEAALRKRRQRLPKKPPVSVASIEELLCTAGRTFPLVTIHCEEIDPEVCWIGQVLGIKRGRLCLLEINPNAKWDSKPIQYRLREITRVNFGGDYESALHLVGGDPPTV
jgi:hypothetical protein